MDEDDALQTGRKEKNLNQDKSIKQPLRVSFRDSFRQIFTNKTVKNEPTPKELSASLRNMANHNPTPSPPPQAKMTNTHQALVKTAFRVALPLQFTPVVEEDDDYGHFILPTGLRKEGAIFEIEFNIFSWNCV